MNKQTKPNELLKSPQAYNFNGINCSSYVEQIPRKHEVCSNVEHKIQKTKQSKSQQAHEKKQGQWTYWEIKKMFKLYAEYGSQWKIIETQFPQKTSNMIKNRFYTTVRAFLKILFRQHPQLDNKLPHEIPSKVILKFFQGREEFVKFKGFGKKILKNIEYDIQSKQLKKIVLSHLQDIQHLYELVFFYRKIPNAQKHNPQQCSQKKQITEKQVIKQIKQIKQQQDNKTLYKTDAMYEQENQVQSPKIQSMKVIQLQTLQIQPMQPINFLTVPTTNFFTLLSFQPYMTYF